MPRDEWRWHLFLRLPDGTGPVGAAVEEVRPGVPAACRLQHVTYNDGRCVQMLHRGAYSDEPASLARMAELYKAEGLARNGLHHEIYLSDPRRDRPGEDAHDPPPTRR